MYPDLLGLNIYVPITTHMYLPRDHIDTDIDTDVDIDTDIYPYIDVDIDTDIYPAHICTYRKMPLRKETHVRLLWGGYDE